MRNFAPYLLRQIPQANDLRTDGSLIAAFLSQRIEDDFAELVRRHGPMVWGVCRRLLPESTDAEDAFQATFLVLVRRGQKLSTYPTIGPWLHRVAVWTARNVRRRNARRLAKQLALGDQTPGRYRDHDLPLDIDAALLSLPENIRASIVLCHLLGFSRADAAARLGCPEGTLSAWLSRGLVRLRTRLSSLDFSKTLGLAAVIVPTELATSTIRAAVASRVAVAAVSSTVSQLVDGVIRMFWIKKATAASVALVAMFAFGMGAGLSVRVGDGQASVQTLPIESVNSATQTPPSNELGEIDKQISELEAQYGKLSETIATTQDKARFDQLQDQAYVLSRAIKKLKARRNQLTAQPAVGPGAPPTLAEIDKELADLKARANALQSSFEALAARRAELMKQAEAKPIAKDEDFSRVEICIGGEEVGVPLHYFECDKQSNRLGAAKVEGQDLLLRLLKRARNDPSAPKSLLIVSWEDAPDDLIETTLRTCQAAGYKEAILQGRVPTNRPGVKFKPPSNDPGGFREGWFQAQEVPVKFDELLRPLPLPKR